MKRIYIVGLLLSLVTSCSDEDSIYTAIDYNKLSYVLGDNHNLSIFTAAVNRSALGDALKQDGPYTLLAPSDEAFIARQYTQDYIHQASGQWVSDLIDYHSLDGRYDFNKLPFQFNQPIRTRNGHYLYVTRWTQDNDTVLLANGVKLLSVGYTASNGFLNVLDKVVEPTTYEKVSDYISSTSSTTIFAHALKRSGLVEELLDDDRYTLFVPNNSAMIQYGFTSIQDVEVASTAELAKLVRRHIQSGIHFTYDYRLTTPFTEISQTGLIYFNVDFYNYETKRVETVETAGGGFRGYFKDNMLDGTEYYFYYSYGDHPTYGNGLERLLISKDQVAYYQDEGKTIIIPNLSNKIADNGIFHVINRVLE